MKNVKVIKSSFLTPDFDLFTSFFCSAKNS